MSTAEPFLEPHEIEDFIRETKRAPQWFYGYEDQELGICPFITFYIYHGESDFVPLGDKLIDLYEEFKTMVNVPLELILNKQTTDWVKPDPNKTANDWRAELRQLLLGYERRDFWIKTTDMSSPAASPLWSFACMLDQVGAQCYATLKLTFRHSWYLKNKERWHAFVNTCLRSLQPEQCYSGFEVGNGNLSVFGNYEAETLERICADYFYGMDIDHPTANAYQFHDDEDGWVNRTCLGAGIRTPTWCFLLSPYWQDRLGKTPAQIREELSDPRIKITALPHPLSKINPEGREALWIELGELSLYPVEDGVPDLLAKASRLIKPIRCDDLNLLSLDPWDDDPNPRFNFQTGPQWMARFDEDSTWPSPERRVSGPSAPDALFAHTDDPCPRSGLWSPRADVPLPDVDVKEGQPMPMAEWHDSQGQYHQKAIKWQWVKALS